MLQPILQIHLHAEASWPADDFYGLSSSIYHLVSPSSDVLVIMGDFNARVGSDHSSWRSVLGPHGIGNCYCNENGECLLDLCVN